MTNSNRIKLTWISFLSYALTGALVIVTGMVMGNIADYFQLPVSSMSNTFTFLNAGILISIFLNAWLMEIIPLKTQLRFGFILMVLAVAGLMFSHSLALFSAAMFVLGLVSGITMSIGTFLITQLYEGRQRGSRLLFTDSFFSMAGMIFPMVAAFLLARSIEWYWVYACIGLVYLAIFILTSAVNFRRWVNMRSTLRHLSPKKNGALAYCFSPSPRCAISSVNWALSPGCRNMPKASA